MSWNQPPTYVFSDLMLKRGTVDREGMSVSLGSVCVREGVYLCNLTGTVPIGCTLDQFMGSLCPQDEIPTPCLSCGSLTNAAALGGVQLGSVYRFGPVALVEPMF